MTKYDEYWDIPEEIRGRLALVAAVFMKTTGASFEDVRDFMAAVVKIYIDWLEMSEKEKVH
jgi:hypothetical protein